MSVAETSVLRVPFTGRPSLTQRTQAVEKPLNTDYTSRPDPRREGRWQARANSTRVWHPLLSQHHRKPRVRLRRAFTCSASSSRDVQILGGLHISQQDADILALLVPALGSVFLDPAMQVIDTGAALHSLM